MHIHVHIYLRHILTHAWSLRALEEWTHPQQATTPLPLLMTLMSLWIEAVAFSFLQTPQSRFLLLPLLIVRLSLLIRKLKKMATWFCLEQLWTSSLLLQDNTAHSIVTCENKNINTFESDHNASLPSILPFTSRDVPSTSRNRLYGQISWHQKKKC